MESNNQETTCTWCDGYAEVEVSQVVGGENRIYTLPNQGHGTYITCPHCGGGGAEPLPSAPADLKVTRREA